MTPADIDRAVEALRRAFPFVSDEGVERFRRELSPLPKWSFMDFGCAKGWSLSDERDVYAETRESTGDWRWDAWTERGVDRGYASTRSEAMRAAERALGLPECEVVGGHTEKPKYAPGPDEYRFTPSDPDPGMDPDAWR